MRFREHLASASIAIATLLTAMQVKAQQSRFMDPEPSDLYNGGGLNIPGFVLLFYIVCIIAIAVKWQDLAVAQRRLGITGAIVGAFFGSSLGIAGGGTAVNGMFFVALVGFLLGAFLAPKQDASFQEMRDDADDEEP